MKLTLSYHVELNALDIQKRTDLLASLPEPIQNYFMGWDSFEMLPLAAAIFNTSEGITPEKALERMAEFEFEGHGRLMNATYYQCYQHRTSGKNVRLAIVQERDPEFNPPVVHGVDSSHMCCRPVTAGLRKAAVDLHIALPSDSREAFTFGQVAA
jgi:hypothetical protein